MCVETKVGPGEVRGTADLQRDCPAVLHVKGDRRANRSLNGSSCGVDRAETEVEVVLTTRRTAGVVDQNSAVYHDAADTHPQTDVFVLWTTADEVLKLQREARNHEPVARFHSWRTELINARAQALVTPSTAHILRLHHDRLILRRNERKTGGSGGALAITICDAVENGEKLSAVRAAH